MFWCPPSGACVVGVQTGVGATLVSSLHVKVLDLQVNRVEIGVSSVELSVMLSLVNG